MAFFIAAGVISNDVIRRETQKGVLTTFRLETGAPRGGKLWIDVECWGHLAGTIARHAMKGRGVSVSGRLIQKTWRDKTTGDARRRYVITASDIDLHPTGEIKSSLVPNAVLLTGRVEAAHPIRTVKSGFISRARVISARTSTKSGRLQIEVDLWHPESYPPQGFKVGEPVSVTGTLAFRPKPGPTCGGQIYLNGKAIAPP